MDGGEPNFPNTNNDSPVELSMLDNIQNSQLGNFYTIHYFILLYRVE